MHAHTHTHTHTHTHAKTFTDITFQTLKKQGHSNLIQILPEYEKRGKILDIIEILKLYEDSIRKIKG